VTVAFLFPGQGSRGLLAALDLAEARGPACALLDRACAATGVPRGRLRAQGGRVLERTAVLQPVLTALALGVYREMAEAGVACDLVLGHSLGELAAWSATGAVSPEDAIEAAALRGRLMEREAARHPGGMIAIPGGDAEVTLALALAPGASVAAWNAPDEVVLAGPEDAVLAVARALPSRRLAVAGAWHGPAMAGAVEELRVALHRLPRRAPSVRLVSGADGDVAPPEGIADRLADQLVRPVRFAAALARLRALGARTVVTVGPGAVLRGLVRKTLGPEPAGPRVLTTDDAGSLARTLDALLSKSMWSHP
jgi:acyl transferase domain-containing protein